MATVGRLLPLLTAYKGRKTVVNKRQATGDIIKEIETAHNEFSADYDKIADQFEGGSARQTAKNIYNFLKKNVKYSVEPVYRQSVKSPAAIIATGQYSNSGNDCKHYSLFSAGILDALNRKGKKYKYCYRFVNYRIFETDPQHVFIVLNPGADEIYLDPVLQPFDYKKPYINGIDKKIKAKMPVYKISGIGQTAEIDEAWGQISLGRVRRTKQAKAVKQQQRQIKKTARVEKRKVKKAVRIEKRKEKGSLFSRTVVRAGLVIPRNSFLKLVALNFGNFAFHLNESLKDPAKKEKLLRKWIKLGGKKEALLNNIRRGIEKYKRKNPAYIGEPVTTAAIISSATAIILALVEFLGKGSKKYAEQGLTSASPEEKAEIQAQTKEIEKMTNEPAASASAKQPGAGQAQATTDAAAADQPEQEQDQPSGLKFDKKYIIIGGVALAAIYLMRK